MSKKEQPHVRFGDKPYRRKDGHLGDRVHVRCEGEHPKTYAFDTHGMNSQQVADRIAELNAYHDAKMAKLREFSGVRGHEFNVQGDTYRVVDCTIFDQGVTLYIDVRKVEQDGALKRVHGFTIKKRCLEIGAIPSNAVILQMIRDGLPEEKGVQSAHEEFVQKVHEKMKAQV